MALELGLLYSNNTRSSPSSTRPPFNVMVINALFHNIFAPGSARILYRGIRESKREAQSCTHSVLGKNRFITPLLVRHSYTNSLFYFFLFRNRNDSVIKKSAVFTLRTWGLLKHVYKDCNCRQCEQPHDNGVLAILSIHFPANSWLCCFHWRSFGVNRDAIHSRF